MKQLALLILGFICSTNAFSQVSDFDIAKKFMSKKGITLVNKPTTRGDNSYNVFKGEDDKGFVIVANGTIIGYSTESKIDEDSIPSPIFGLIEQQNRATTRSHLEFPSWFKVRNTTPIDPLIKTKWGQTEPYNDLIERKTGICAHVAYAQLLHYYRVPQTYSDVYEEKYTGGTFLPSTTFNHDLMLDSYLNVDYTEEQAHEVAKLFQYVDLIGYDGMSWEDGFHIDTILYSLWEISSFYEILDAYLDKSNPLWMAGNNHAYLVDGRDDQGLYHVNFGWCGLWDGYYVFPDKEEHRTLINANAGEKYTYDVVCALYFAPKGWTSSINNVYNSQHNDHSVYNLQGLRVGNGLESLPKGIYIKDGKKYVIN